MTNILRHKHLWSLEFYDSRTYETIIPRGLVVIKNRPSITIDPVYMQAPSGRSHLIPGRQTFDPLVATYKDLDNNDGAHYFMEWSAKVLDSNFSDFDAYKTSCCLLRLWSTHGEPHDKEWGCLLETWDLEGVLLQAVNWGSINNMMPEIEISLRYSNVDFFTNE